jgi:hypothetical protein
VSYRKRVRTARWTVLVLAGVGTAPAAFAEEADAEAQKRSCIAAHVRAQELNNEDRLTDALAHAIACGQEACPGAVRAACTTLAQNISASIPSVIVETRLADGTAASARDLVVDAKPIPAADAEKPIELDPGNHVLSATIAGRRVEKRVFVPSGKKRQLVTLSLPAAPTSTATPARDEPRAVPGAVYGLGAVAVLGFASFTYFGLSGRSKQDDLEDCKPSCDPGQREPIERDYLIADLSLLVGVAALGAGAWIYFSAQKQPEKPASGLRWFLKSGTRAPQLSAGARF